MKLECKNVSIDEAKSSTLVLFATEQKTTSKSVSKNSKSTTKIAADKSHSETKVVLVNAPKDLSERLSAALSDGTIKAKLSETTFLREFHYKHFRNVLIVGIGKHVDSEAARQAAAATCGALGSTKDALILIDSLAANKKDLESSLQGFVEGLYLAAYSFDELKSKKSEEKEVSIVLSSKFAKEKNFVQAVATATTLSECVNFSRRLGDMPGNLMTPSILANEAVKAAKGTGLKVTVWDKARIKKERMGGLLGVNQGAAEEPRFIIMEYTGAAKTKKPIVFVGKGLTFDCGGISIKPSAGMEEMKYDMCGGANVIGTMLAIAKLKLKINVIGLVPSTENLVGPSATKPGDIHTARNGKTFEVNNTDAEGRLILADALSYATELEPQAIVDVATLTGAMLMALGNIHTGYFTRSKDLVTKVEKAAGATGELVWNMPLTDFHVKDMKGTYADLSNISSGKGAGSATAAAFLEQFVGEGIPWAHFDIAGTGWHIGNRWNYHPKKGASGIMIRTFVELAKSLG